MYVYSIRGLFSVDNSVRAFLQRVMGWSNGRSWVRGRSEKEKDLPMSQNKPLFRDSSNPKANRERSKAKNSGNRKGDRNRIVFQRSPLAIQ